MAFNSYLCLKGFMIFWTNSDNGKMLITYIRKRQQQLGKYNVNPKYPKQTEKRWLMRDYGLKQKSSISQGLRKQ